MRLGFAADGDYEQVPEAVGGRRRADACWSRERVRSGGLISAPAQEPMLTVCVQPRLTLLLPCGTTKGLRLPLGCSASPCVGR